MGPQAFTPGADSGHESAVGGWHGSIFCVAPRQGPLHTGLLHLFQAVQLTFSKPSPPARTSGRVPALTGIQLSCQPFPYSFLVTGPGLLCGAMLGTGDMEGMCQPCSWTRILGLLTQKFSEWVRVTP